MAEPAKERWNWMMLASKIESTIQINVTWDLESTYIVELKMPNDAKPCGSMENDKLINHDLSAD